MTESVQIMERLTNVSPIGLRFWDGVTGRYVADDRLIVTAYTSARPDKKLQSFRNPSVVYMFRDLPTLRDVENGAGDEAFWNSVSSSLTLTIEVEDRDGRFLPFLFEIDVPVLNIYGSSSGSPPSSEPGVPLFSSAGRPVPLPFAVIRGQLSDASQDSATAAAWALVEAYVSGTRVARTMADDEGRFVLMFAYPEPAIALDSPPSGSSLRQQEWAISLSVLYDAPGSVPEVPDLNSVLNQQAAVLWTDSDRTEVLPDQRLRFGEQLIVRSRNSSDGADLSVLLVTPVGSPP